LDQVEGAGLQDEGLNDFANDQESPTPEEMELPDELVAELRTLIKKFAIEEMPNRRQELIRTREGRFFWRGYQYPLYNSDAGAWAVPETGGFPFATSEDRTSSSRFYYVHNVYTPLGKALISALAGSMPGVKFLPEDPFDIDDIDAAKESENYRKFFYHYNDMPQFIKDVARYYYTDGRVVAHVHQRECGVDEEGNPKLEECVDLYGVLEHKCPIALRSVKEFPYQQISYEVNVSQLKSEYPEKADKIKDNTTGPGEDAFDRICRLGTLQGTQMMMSGDTYAHLATKQTTWMRPMAFQLIKDKIKRDALASKFPDGVKVVYAGETFLEATNEDMDDCLVVSLAMPGDGQACPSLGEFVVPVQKRLNNLTNILQEKYEKGSATKFVDSKAIDTDALIDQIASPEVYIPVKRPAGEQLSNLFFKEPEPQASQDFIGTINGLKTTDAQFLSGAQPSIFGGPMTNSKTASVYAQARDQALGAMSVTYGPMKRMVAEVTDKAKNLARQREQGSIPGMIPNGRGTYENLSIDVNKMRAGECRCHPEVDDAIPESFSAQRQAFMSMIQFMGPNPDFQKLLMQPDNQYLFKTLTGIEGFTVPGADSRNKQLREIEELLDSKPEMPTPDELQKVAQHQTMLQVAGQPSPTPKPEDLMRPSVEVDPDFDDHQAEFAECQRWINSDEGQQAKVFNPQGFMNVRLHALQHKRALIAGPAGAGNLQDNVPDPAAAARAASAKAAMADHAQGGGVPGQAAGQAPPAGGAAEGGPPPTTLQ
jgi:hypothetical protein